MQASRLWAPDLEVWSGEGSRLSCCGKFVHHLPSQSSQLEYSSTKLGPQDNLTATIFSQYNKHNPPSHNESTRVKMGVILRSVANLFWTDPRLAWNESNFDGIDVLRLPASQLWIPDIVLYNSVAEWETLSPVHVLAYPDGIVYSIAPLSVKSSCEMNLAKYPYDVQNCTLVWGSWIHDESMISLQPSDPALDLHDLVPNPRWEVVDTSVVRHVKKYNCCIESFVDLSVSVILRRRHPDSFIASSVIAAWMDLLNERRRRYFRLLDLGAMIVTVVLLSIMTGALFAS
ncbi:neuronal acetylcholine receptor subunit alpha-6-like [Diadema antillarum]|uniref:neuronal acetylcholine receptor subunit alpha-6-like n=1 Tax=Diadema antillarum TaxID=105358 RepID=UPI003A852D0A